MHRDQALEMTLLREEEIPLYLETGRAAYRDHYCHLWPKGDPWPYLTRNFTEELVRSEIHNPELKVFLVRSGGMPAGICKLDLSREFGATASGNSIFLEKIYFKRPFTGRGLGSSVIGEIIRMGTQWGRDFLWLEAMQKGPALSFYLNHGFSILGETEVPHPEVLESEKKMWVLGRKF